MGKKIEFLKNVAVVGGKALGKGVAETWKGGRKAVEAIAETRMGQAVSKKASEWKNNITETLKLETTEKMKMLMSRGKENFFLSMKDNDIDKVDEETGKQKGRIFSYQEEFKKDEAEAERLIASNPAFEAEFRRGVAARKVEMERKIEIANEKIVRLSERKDQYSQQREQFKKRIESIESGFAKKIDAKVESVKTGHHYKERINEKKVLDENVNQLSAKIKEREKDLAKYEVVFGYKELLTPEDIGKFKEIVRIQKEKLKVQRKELERAEKARDKNDRQIGKIDRKTQRLEGIKTKYGLGKKEKPATTPAPESVTPGGGASPVEEADSGALGAETAPDQDETDEENVDEVIVGPQSVSESGPDQVELNNEDSSNGAEAIIDKPITEVGPEFQPSSENKLEAYFTQKVKRVRSIEGLKKAIREIGEIKNSETREPMSAKFVNDIIDDAKKNNNDLNKLKDSNFLKNLDVYGIRNKLINLLRNDLEKNNQQSVAEEKPEREKVQEAEPKPLRSSIDIAMEKADEIVARGKQEAEPKPLRSSIDIAMEKADEIVKKSQSK